MKSLYAAAIAALILNPSPVLAADAAIDVNDLTCEIFLNYDDQNRGLIMMWFEGYYTEEDEPATIDFGAMAKHLTKLLIACEKDPTQKLLDISDEAMED
jgi:hypothetical protein